MKRSKKYVEASGKFEKNKKYTKEEALKLVKEMASANFDETVEVSMNLNLDTKKSDQQLRGATVLPNGIGKTAKVLVIAKGVKATDGISTTESRKIIAEQLSNTDYSQRTFNFHTSNRGQLSRLY